MHRNPRHFSWLLLAGSLALAGCAVTDMPEHAAAESPSSTLYDVAGLTAHAGAASRRPPATAEIAAIERKMIWNATLTLQVAAIEPSIVALVAKLQELGGHLSARSLTSVTCRVPTDRFRAFVEQARRLGRVIQDDRSAREVTKEHRDLTIRLDNARKARARLLALLEKAEKVEDILKIEKELTRLTELIERLEGELRWLNDQVALATVAVNFQPLVESSAGQGRPSRFRWINRIGVERVLQGF